MCLLFGLQRNRSLGQLATGVAAGRANVNGWQLQCALRRSSPRNYEYWALGTPYYYSRHPPRRNDEAGSEVSHKSTPKHVT